MTVTSTKITAGPYAGNGVSDTFSYTFGIEDKSEIKVFETNADDVQVELTVDIDYTVNDVGVETGGTVTRNAGPLPSGYTWYMRSNYIETQETEFESQGAFFPDIHEKAFDKSTRLIQQLQDTLDRAVKFSESYTGDGTATLPSPTGGYLLRWLENSVGFENVWPSDLTGVVTLDADLAKEFANVASAVADLTLTLNKRVNTKAYYTRGGGASYNVVAGGTGVHDGGLYIDLDNGLQLELIPMPEGSIGFRQFGIVGDNIVDDTVQLERALATGMILKGEDLHLKLTKVTGFTFNNDIIGRNVTFDYSSIGANVFRKLLYSTGVQKSEVFVGNVLANSNEVVYTGDVAVGDIIVIHNAESCFAADVSEGILRGELFEVVKLKAGNIIQLDRSVLLTLNTATGTVYTPTTASVIGISFIGNGFDITENNETAIQIEFGKDNIIEYCQTRHVEHYSVNVDSCLRPAIRFNNFVHDQPTDAEAQLIQDAGKVIYAIAIFNCTSLLDCHDNIISGAKHQIDFTQNSQHPGYGVFNNIHDNLLFSCWHASIGTHDANTETLVVDNTIYDVMRGIEFRTPNNYAYNNNIKTSRLRGVSGGEGVNLTEDFSGCEVVGNVIDGKTWCIRSNLGLPSTGVKINGNSMSQVNGAHSAIDFDTILIDSEISGNSAIGDNFSATTLIKSSVVLDNCSLVDNVSKGQVIDIDATTSTIKDNTRKGDGFCVSVGVGTGNIITDNTSTTGAAVVAAVGNVQRGNFSGDSFNAKIRDSSGDKAIDVFDTFIQVDPDGFTTLDRIFTNLFDGIFTLNLASGSVTVNHSVTEVDSIRTVSGSSYVWNAGVPLILVKTPVGFFQIVAL